MSYNDLRKGRFSKPGREYFITFAVAGRRQIFSNLQAARLMIAELRRLEEEGNGTWLAWVIMPDHFHGLFSLGDITDLGTAMRSLKGRSSRVLNIYLKTSGSFWQPGYYDRTLRRDEDRKAIARYIVANPIRAGLVDSVWDYSHWDAVYL